MDAIVLARAGLVRLGREGEATEILEVERCLPAVGQGALGIERRSDDTEVRRLFQPLHDTDTPIAIAAERGVMVAVGGGCHVPMTAYAVRDGEALWLRAMPAAPDGLRLRRRECRVSWPEDVKRAHTEGVGLGRLLAEQG